VSKRLGRRAPDLSHELVVNLACGLFPASPHTDWASIPNVSQPPTVLVDLPLTLDDEPLVPPITAQEIGSAVARLPLGKAPGPDLIPNEVIRLAYNKFPEQFTTCYNTCLSSGVFPARWKRAKVVLLYKGQGKARDLPSSYRPISLLDGVGKAFERVLLNRLIHR